MKNKPKLWLLYLQAKAWRVTPSSLLGVEDAYVSFCLNEACFEWGVHVESKLQSVTGRNEQEKEGRRKLVLRSLMSEEGPKANYAVPTATK